MTAIKLRTFGILLFLTCIGYLSSGQNLQYAPLFSQCEPIQLNADDENVNILWTTATGNYKFLPDVNNFNYLVEQNEDPFLLCYNKAGKYQWHVQFSGKGSSSIVGVTYNKSKELFVLVRSGSDSLKIIAPTLTTPLTASSGNVIKNSYLLFKFDLKGEVKYFKNLGETFSNDVFIYLLNTPFEKDIVLAASIQKVHQIPGTQDTVYASIFKYKHLILKVSSNNLTTLGYEFISDISNQPISIDNNTIWVVGQTDSTAYTKIYATLMGGGIFSDSTSLPFGVDLKTSVFHNNSFYLAFRSTNNAVVNGHTFSTTNIGYKDYVVIWKSGSLIDSSSLPFIKSGQIYPAFALSKSGKLYFGCDVYRMGDTSIIGLNFIKGRKQNFNSEYFKYWGPIVNDSFEWTSRLEGSGPGTSIMSVDENSQYISSSVGHWVDFDPGPYKWQYNPTVYIGRNVMAAYNCYPNAIFTYNQQDQRIDLVNFSSGSDSFLWDFGFNKQTSKEPNPVVHYPAVGDYTITLIAFNDCGSDTFSFPININKISSVENIALEDFNVFPNPFSDYIEIATTHETEITQIILYSINGKERLSANPQTLNKFNLNHLKNGTYIIRLIHENGSSSKRIVKQ